MAQKVAALAKLIEAKLNLPVHLFDERLTSYEADGLMGPMELTRAGKKQRRDALAAATILRDFMNHLDQGQDQNHDQSQDQENIEPE